MIAVGEVSPFVVIVLEERAEVIVIAVLEVRTRIEVLEEIVHVKLKAGKLVLIGRRCKRLMTLRIILTTFSGITEDIVSFSDCTKGFFSFGLFVLIRMIF